MRDRTHDESMAELFASDPQLAARYLDDILVDGQPRDLLVALRQMSAAFGGVARIAADARLNPTQLYRTLSPQGNPEVRSLAAILHTMGLRLSVAPLARSGRASKGTSIAARTAVAVLSKNRKALGGVTRRAGKKKRTTVTPTRRAL